MMIETTNLSKQYGDLTAVDGVDIDVEAGSIHGFIGPNGAGKTTTMQMLVGLIEPTEGEAYIDGEPAGSLAAKETIGYSPQDPAMYESMTGQEYLSYMGKTAGMSSTAVSERSAELLEWLELSDAADQEIGGYSGGMKRRISLAQAMIHDPELLILDEPTAALDPSGRMKIIESLEDLTEEGMTVFVSSHVLAELEKFIDTVTILHDGKQVATGPVETVQDQFGGKQILAETADDERVVELLADSTLATSVRHDEDDGVVVVTDDPDEFKLALMELLVEEGIVLDSLTDTGGLEEAFADVIEQREHGESQTAAHGDDPGDDATEGEA